MREPVVNENSNQELDPNKDEADMSEQTVNLDTYFASQQKSEADRKWSWLASVLFVAALSAAGWLGIAFLFF